MPPKGKKSYRQYKRKSTKKRSKPSLNKEIMKVLNKNIETKSGVISSTDGEEIQHNSFVVRSTNILATRNGTFDAEATKGYRIGDSINLIGVSIKMMLELNERYSECTFRVLIIRAAKGDTPTVSTLWNGASGNKMIDTIDKERYTVIHQKYIKISSPNNGMIATGLQTVGSGWTTGVQNLSRATKIVKLWIPGNKFSKSKKIQYENNGSEQVKFYDYHYLIYAYSNYSVVAPTDLTAGFAVGRINDEIVKMYYKDA